MRAVVQRVTRASVTVDGQIVGAIDRGLAVLVGVDRADGPADAAWIAAKVRDLRLFGDDAGRMTRAVGEVAGAVLVVSQFTLLGDCRRGRRPSYAAAAPAAHARGLYDEVIARLRADGLPVRTGAFQAAMAVELVNDGPVTVLLDSRRVF